MDKECRYTEAQIIDYINNELSIEETQKFEQHLKKCNRCNTKTDDYIKLYKGFDLIKDEEVPVEVEENFLNLIKEESDKINTPDIKKSYQLSPVFLRAVAAIVLLITGVLIGMQINTNNTNTSAENEALKNEIQELKDMVMISLHQQHSASDRIQAVNYIEESNTVDEELINALINTLNTDENTNVRMTAANALKRFGKFDFVRKAYIRSLELQTDPSVQITIINILIELKEKGGIIPMQKLLIDDNAHEIVKKQAEIGIEVLI